VVLTNVRLKEEGYVVYKSDMPGTLLGRQEGKDWKLSRLDLQDLKVDREITLGVTGQVQSLDAVVKMQFNPLIFDFKNKAKSKNGKEIVALRYADDADDCRRNVRIFAGSINRSGQFGHRDCAYQRKFISIERGYERSGLRKIVRSLDGCSLGESGITYRGNDNCVVTLRVPRETEGSALLLKVQLHEEARFYNRNSVMGIQLGWSRISSLVLGQLHWLNISRRENSQWIDIQVRRSKIPTFSEYVDRYEDLKSTWELIDARLRKADLSQFNGFGGLTPAETADYWIMRGTISKEDFGQLHLKESQRRVLFLENIYSESGPAASPTVFLSE